VKDAARLVAGRYIEQGADKIDIAAPIDVVWGLVSDSVRLAEWGPPVKSVTVLSPLPEGVGSRRRIEAAFDGRAGSFIETRIEHEEGRALAYLINEETFGLFKMLRDVGFRIELDRVDAATTRVVWTFFHEPHGFLGRVMNPLVIRRAQRKNRLAALAALKAHAERTVREPR
jgi:hypothetical protein